MVFAVTVPLLNGYLRLFITEWVSAPADEQDSSYFLWRYLVLTFCIIVGGACATLSLAFLYLYFSQ